MGCFVLSFFSRRDRAPKEIGRGNKSQLPTWRSSTLSLLCREVHLGHYCSPSWRQDPAGPPSACRWHSVTHTAAGRACRHVPSVGALIFFTSTWRGVCQQTCHSVVFLRFGPSSWAQRCLRDAKRNSKPSLNTFWSWRCPPFQNTYFTLVLKTPLSHKVEAV